MSNGKPSELATLTGGRAIAIYWCPPIETGPTDGRRGPLLLIAAPGSKPFIRVWLDDTTFRPNSGAKISDWTWHKPNDAIRIDDRLTLDPATDRLVTRPTT